jgi:hypothetical protein
MDDSGLQGEPDWAVRMRRICTGLDIASQRRFDAPLRATASDATNVALDDTPSRHASERQSRPRQCAQAGGGRREADLVRRGLAK